MLKNKSNQVNFVIVEKTITKYTEGQTDKSINNSGEEIKIKGMSLFFEENLLELTK
jgi:hypothetical protein